MSTSSPLSPESRQQLQTLAEAATAGEWRCDGWDVFNSDGEWEACIDSPVGLLATVPSGKMASDPQPDNSHTSYRDAEFIAAANPPTVLALLSALAAQEAENEQLKRENAALRKPMQKHCPSCVDAQCWGTRQPLEAENERLRQENEALIEGSSLPCHEQRRRLHYDQIEHVGLRGGHWLVKCVKGLHAGNYIVWSQSGRMLAIGTREWCIDKSEAEAELAALRQSLAGPTPEQET